MHSLEAFKRSFRKESERYIVYIWPHPVSMEIHPFCFSLFNLILHLYLNNFESIEYIGEGERGKYIMHLLPHPRILRSFTYCIMPPPSITQRKQIHKYKSAQNTNTNIQLPDIMRSFKHTLHYAAVAEYHPK